MKINKALTLYFTFLSIVLVAQSNKIDSILYKISIAKGDTSKLKLYTWLFGVCLDINPALANQNEKEALALAEKLKWEKGNAPLFEILGRIKWRTGNFEQALQYHFDALKIYKELGNDNMTARLTSYIGQDYADQGNYFEALKYFNQALKWYQELGKKSEIGECYLFFSFVYGMVGNMAEAVKANYDALKIFESLNDPYPMSIATSNLADQYVKMEKYDEALEYYQKAIKALEKTTDKVNLSSIYLSIGNVYRSQLMPDKAKENYLTALEIGEQIHDAFCMGQAYEKMAGLYEAQGDLDASLENYFSAEQLYRSVSNNTRLAFVCDSIGMLYLRSNDLNKSKEYFDKSFTLTENAGTLPLREAYYNGVQSLDSAGSNWKNAYVNYRKYITYRDSLYNETNTKASMQTVMQYEFDKKEAAAKAEQVKKDIRQRTIRNSIAGVLLGSFIFLIVVYRQRNKIAKARKRSDELLLNILPSEVAEELKSKGSAEAKQFDYVTVMFTDFKGFTQISEKLSPAELVSEIDSYFKTFDTIITTHKIEKIKTIGDAYMCAGGLPVANTTHAVDVVKAALEIQQYMDAHLHQRKNNGKEVFEIRIGIHTGPVVAGIVGLKKFAYDIWGDTVNIASRMESSGEAGKVNISGSTYELVKDKFSCTYRGKVEAKNKGEIDMYFVEKVL